MFSQLPWAVNFSNAYYWKCIGNCKCNDQDIFGLGMECQCQLDFTLHCALSERTGETWRPGLWGFCVCLPWIEPVTAPNQCLLSVYLYGQWGPHRCGTFWCVLPDPIRNVQRLVVKLSGLSLELPPSARTVLQPSTASILARANRCLCRWQPLPESE